MPSKNKPGCGCCTACCATLRELAADITVGSLPGITDMRIDVLNEGTCSASSDGTLGVTAQTGNGFERPTTAVPGTPAWGLNATMAGKWSRQDYSLIGTLFIYDIDGYLDSCYYLNNLAGDTELDMQITAPSGTFALVTGSEPNVWPYWVRMEYYVYEDGAGDCILRVGAYFVPRIPLDLDAATSAPVAYFFKEALSTGTWPVTLVDPVKYSDHNPCGEDLGVLPVVGSPAVGAWVSGFTEELEDNGVASSTGAGAGSLTNGQWQASDLTQSSDGTFESEVLTGLGGVNVSGGDLGLLWEVNLTDASITDLNTLPDTTLDTSNCIGVYTGDIKGTYTAVGSLPVGFFTGNNWQHHSTGSTALSSSSIGTSGSHSILNGGAGTHVCGTLGSPGDCVSGHPYDGGGFPQRDLVYWEYEYDVQSSTTGTAWSGISITLGQP